MAVKIQFEIGHTSKLKSKKTREGFTHDWELYVKGVNGADIGCFVEKVVFNLHDSFPKPKRVCKESPYMIQESGYAGFMLPIDIYLRNRDEPKMLQFNYDLALHTTGPPQHRSDIQKYIFENPSEEFRQKLMKGGGIPVAGVMPGSVATPLQPLGLGQEGHKSTSTESKKHKSRSDDAKVASFTDLFGTPLTKGVSTASNKPSPDYRSGNGNQVISKPGTHTPQNSASNSLSKEKLNKEKSTSSGEKLKDRQERKEKHPKSSGSSPQKDARSGESKSKHERRDKNEDKAKKDKVRDKDKERNREKNSSSINVLQNTAHGSSTTTNTGTSASSSLKRPNSPKREVSPRRNSPAGLTNSGSIGTLNNTIGRPTSSNGGRIEADNKTTSIKSSSKDTAGSIDAKSKESKARDSSSSSGKKSKKDRKERDKDKDRERDKEKQKSMDTTQARPHNNPAMVDTNAFNIDTNKSSKAGSMLIAGATNANGNVETAVVKREKTSKATGEKSNDKTISSSNTTGGAPTSSSTSAPVLSLSQAEKGKNSSSNNSTSSTSSAAGGGSGVGGGSGTGSNTYSVEKDKQRSHKHKKREKNKDRDRDKERERDKDKDLKKEDKKEKEKNEKPIENKASTPNAMAKPLNSPSLPNLLEDNKEATLAGSGAGTLNPTTSNSSNKKSQNKEKKSREKSSNREEKTKRKQGEIETAAGKVKQIKISGTQATQIAPTSSSSSSTSEHPPTTGTTPIVPLAQPSMDLSDNDSLPATSSAAVAVVPNSATSSSANEQGNIKNNNSNNNSNSSKNKVASNLNHSDSSNSGCSSDMPLKAPQTVNNSSNSNSRGSDTTKMNAPPNSNSSRDAAKNLSNNKISKDKKAGDKAEKTDKEEKKRRRTSTVNNTFIEPPLKQMKRDKESNKGNREKCNKSPSIRSGPTRTSSGSNSDVTNTFLQPSASPSSSSTAAAPLPAPSSANTTPNNTAHSPVLNAAEAVGNATSATVNAAISVNSATIQQQPQSATLQVPPSQNPLPTDYWTELQELQHKIMTLQDSEDLQHVVELIAATGCYEITTKTFDFDLCKLDRNTVQRLQEFFATSVA